MTNNELQVLRDMIDRERGMINLVVIDGLMNAFDELKESERDYLVSLVQDLWLHDEEGKSIYVVIDAIRSFMEENNYDVFEVKQVFDELNARQILMKIGDWLYA